MITGRTCRGHEAIGQPAEGERLQDYVAGAGECRVEESFAAEQRVREAADELDVVVDRLGHRDDAAGIDAKLLARGEIELQHVAAGVKENKSLSADLLEQEAFAAEQPRA